MSISAAGAAAGLVHEGLPTILGVTPQSSSGSVHIIHPGCPAGACMIVTAIDVYSYGDGSGDLTCTIFGGGADRTFWNDTFGVATEGSRHWRGMQLVRVDQTLDIHCIGFHFDASAHGFFLPHNANFYWPV